MRKFTMAQRLQQILNERNLKQVDVIRLTEPLCLAYKIKIGRNDISQYLAGKVEPRQNKLYILAKALAVNEAWLMGYDVPMERREDSPLDFSSPSVTSDFVTFPVIGEIAAGFDNIGYEDWTGDTIDIPLSYLGGRPKEDYFVLNVKGNSMYPIYHDGDRVLILKQSTLNRSGDIGAILYDDEITTLKKVEYVPGEDWLILIPLNPEYTPQRIEGEQLEHCRVLGIPRLLIREIN